MMQMTMVSYLIMSLLYAIPILIAVAFLTLVERKILSYMQSCKGPNTVGPFGLLQPIADGIKLFIKEPVQLDFSGVSMLYSRGVGMFLVAGWGLLLTLFVVLELVRGLSRGAIRAV